MSDLLKTIHHAHIDCEATEADLRAQLDAERARADRAEAKLVETVDAHAAAADGWAAAHRRAFRWKRLATKLHARLAEAQDRRAFAESSREHWRALHRELGLHFDDVVRLHDEQADRADKADAEVERIRRLYVERGDLLLATALERDRLSDDLARARKVVEDLSTPRSRDSWHEDDGTALWWTLPVEEPPYCGTPLDDDFPDYATHWTPLPALAEHDQAEVAK